MAWKKIKKVVTSVHFQIFVVVIGIGLIVSRYSRSVSDGTDRPIIRATAMGDYDTVRALLKRGVNPDTVDESLDGPLAKSGPLAVAVWNSNLQPCRNMVDLFLLHNADVQARDLAQQCPIHKVVKIDFQDVRMDILSRLIKFGADIDARDTRQSSFLDIVIETDDYTFVRSVLDVWGKILSQQFVALAKKRAEDRSLLDLVDIISGGARTIVMDAHWDPRTIDAKTGLSDLHCAVIKNDTTLATAVIAKGVSSNVASEDRYGLRPLHMAVLHRLSQMITFLLSKQADVNARDAFGNTPLYYTASIADIKTAQQIADILLNNGARINAVNNEGNTLLHMLVYANNKDLIEFIGKKYTFDRHIKNEDMESVEDLVIRLNRKELLKNIK